MNITNFDITRKFFLILRRLQEDNNSSILNDMNASNEMKKEQLKQLYIFIAILVLLIILILGGYALYRRYLEKKAMQEFNHEHELMLLELLNSFSSNNNSPGNRRANSYNNNLYPNSLQNIENELRPHEVNSSIENNQEERLEKIRKKYGNSVIIKCILNKHMEEIKFNKRIGEEYGDNCTICLENFTEVDLVYKTPCEHIFHKKCFSTYLKKINKKDKLTCPNGNQNLLLNKKFLKLRAKTKHVEAKKISVKNNNNKESEINLESHRKKENKDNSNDNDSANNEIILLKKKAKLVEENKLNQIENRKKNKNKGNIYKPTQLDIKKNDSDRDTVLSLFNNNNNSNLNNRKKLKLKNIVIIDNNLLPSKTNINSEKSNEGSKHKK